MNFRYLNGAILPRFSAESLARDLSDPQQTLFLFVFKFLSSRLNEKPVMLRTVSELVKTIIWVGLEITGELDNGENGSTLGVRWTSM